jgi:2'-5' RNA ligase
MMRLYLGCPLPSTTERELDNVIRTLKERDGAVRWVASKNIHLTIRFLGDTDERLVDDIAQKVDTIARQFPAVHTVIDKLGAFPNLRKPRIIWAGIQSGIETLAQVAAAAELSVQDLGFEAETKGFKAHLTLGRVRDRRKPEELVSFLSDYQLTPIPVLFDRVVLFKSTLTPTGPIYERLHEAQLQQ